MIGPILIAPRGDVFLAPILRGAVPPARDPILVHGGVRLGDVAVFPYGVTTHRVETGPVRNRLRALTDAARPELAGRQLPATRAGCPPDPDACAYLSCAMHLALDVTRAGTIAYTAPVRGYDADGLPDLDLDALPHRCALALAERGGMELHTIGAALLVSRERARRIESAALTKLRKHVDAAALETPPDRVGAWDLAGDCE